METLSNNENIRKLIRLSKRLHDDSQIVYRKLKKQGYIISLRGYQKFIDELEVYYPYDFIRIMNSGIDLILWCETLREIKRLIEHVISEEEDEEVLQTFSKYEILLTENIKVIEDILKETRKDLAEAPLSQ